jgi:glycosyltransferase involved in cell wall biosynthesis
MPDKEYTGMLTLSIITPTYNRAELLPRCYDSLQKQTSCDFEWIIVDDGSTDNTAEVVASFSSNHFPIIYVKKSNGGKHTALNAAHAYVHGKFVMILDSDDYLAETAVQDVSDAWGRYEQDQKIGIVTFLKGTDRDHPVCAVADYDVPVEIMHYRRIRFIRTDCCEVIRAELFRKYPFPEYQGEIFLAESALWDRVSFTHKCVYINSVVYFCEYLEGGLTQSGRKLRLRNPYGGMFTSELRMDRRNALKDRIKNGLLYNCYGKAAGIPLKELFRKCRSPWLALLCAPGGRLLFHCWCRNAV